MSHPSLIGTLSLTALYLNLHGLLATQIQLNLLRNQTASNLVLSTCLAISLLIWLKTLPYKLISQKTSFQVIAAVSLLLGFLVLLCSGAGMIFFRAIFHTLPPNKLPLLEWVFLWTALASSLLSACITTSGMKLIRKYADLEEQSSHFQSLAQQQTMTREIFEIIHRTNSQEEVCRSVLKTVLEITRAESACIIPYQAKTKRFGPPLASLPETNYKQAGHLTLLPNGVNTLSLQKSDQRGLALPIQFGDQTIAFLMIHQPEPIPHFSTKRSLLHTLCQQTGIALNRIQTQKDKRPDENNSSLQLAQTLVENLGLGIFATLETGELAFMNPTAESLLGWDSLHPDLGNQPFLPLIQEKNQALSPCGTKPQTVLCEKKFIRKDGAALPVFCVSAPIPINSKQRGTLYVFHDLSQQKQVESELKEYARQLQESNKNLEQFAYMASHDLQAPLIKLQQFSGILSKSTSLDTDGQDIAHRIKNTARHMQELVQNVLMLAKASTELKKFEPVDLQQLLQSVLEEQEERIKQLDANIQVSPMPIIDGSPFLLRILLNNLLDNALKFARPGIPPQISFTCHISESYQCHLHVQDNGIGFSEEQAHRIFNMFERLNTGSNQPGHGIGLSICKKIIEQHGGTITASSTANIGTAFTVTLPVKQST